MDPAGSNKGGAGQKPERRPIGKRRGILESGLPTAMPPGGVRANEHGVIGAAK